MHDLFVHLPVTPPPQRCPTRGNPVTLRGPSNTTQCLWIPIRVFEVSLILSPVICIIRCASRPTMRLLFIRLRFGLSERHFRLKS